MSHVTTLNLNITDLEALDAACKTLGLELVRGQTKFHTYFTQDGSCEHAIRIPNDKRAYEIGLITRRDGQQGYQMLWDTYAGGYGMVAKVGDGMSTLKKNYAAKVSAKYIQKQGFRVTQRIATNGNIIVEGIQN